MSVIGSLAAKVRHSFGQVGPLLLFVALAFLMGCLAMVLLPFLVDPVNHPIAAPVVYSGILVLMLGPVAWFMFLVPLARLNDLKSRLMKKLIAAQEETLGRVARDLHDGLGRSVTGLLVGIRSAEETTGEPRVKDMLRALRDQGTSAHEDLRRLVRGLRPYQLEELGLAAALRLEAETLQERSSVNIDFAAAQETDDHWPKPAESALYRIAQEAMMNALDHGKPTFVRIRVFHGSDGLGVEITDDGGGFDAAAAWAGTTGRRSFGLLSMRERATLLGGTFRVDSHPGSCTVVRAAIPVDGQPHEVLD